MADDFERMWADLAPIGRSAASGGYFRQPFLTAERELSTWFAEQAAARGLVLETDAFGNQVAWWDPPGIVPDVSHSDTPFERAKRQGLSQRRRPNALLTGSHLDSVLDGGAYDGPLGVVSALAAIDLMRERGVVPRRPIGVSVFVEEEGSRFSIACLGSRLATGAIAWAEARELADREGVRLGDVVAGPEPAGDESVSSWVADVATYVELHVEQGRDLVDRNAAIGVASEIWPHGRYRFDITGEANHAGTTRMEDRADPMLTYAMTALAANKQARLGGGTGGPGPRATFGRVEVAPNGTNAVPSRVTAWLDARCAREDELADLVAVIERQAGERAGRDGTVVEVSAESVSGAVHFDADLARAIAADHSGGDWPIIATQAGHDAGILSSAGVPSAMLFVRNPSGVSHSPAETAAMPDCLVGVSALADTLARLGG
ncbi:MAG: allantoate amidohydrolase [Nocardioides sp.]